MQHKYWATEALLISILYAATRIYMRQVRAEISTLADILREFRGRNWTIRGTTNH
jgi:hypothetical protein